ncbi:carbohydrate ABC transporter permease [Curtobacterium ammoniigenes]|uniref:carbohydrate ABC transporter permease n=1 Tax=Curtobacterium ammoniigenes TaxID=395387 RepID=UPI00083634B4|nr:sugar ABC transporter permease [Curtobacterium ammoniigenes]
MSVFEELRSVRSARSSGKRDNKAAFIFLLPWLIGFICITLGPMIASLWISFTNYNLIQKPQSVGFANYIRMFQDPRLINSLRVTFEYVFVSVPIQLALALALALLLDRGMRALPLYRSIFYLPSLLGSSVAVAILWRQIFGQGGLVNQVLGGIGLHNLPGWISDPRFALGTIILLNIWTFGAPMIIFLAGLRQIPDMYYEAASIDGAGRWTRFAKVTLPMLSPIIFFNIILQLIGAFQSFTQAFVVSGGTGGPSDSTMFYSLYLYQQGFANFNMGYASAMAWLLFIIIAIITAVTFVSSKYWVFYDN